MSGVDSTWAVVVNWNGGETNLRCLASLVAGGVDVARIVFVDNASRDGSLESVGEAFPGLRQISNGSNLGFGAAANQGARLALEAGAGCVLFANNDVTFPPGSVERLSEALVANPRVGMLGPRVLYPATDQERPQRVWAAGGMLAFGPNVSVLLHQGQVDHQRLWVTREVDYVPGCALFARAQALHEVGLFEEDYFAYMEDVELGLRARRAGWQVLCMGQVACEHAPSSSTGGGYNARRKFMNGLNSVHYLRAHGSWAQWLALVLFDVLALPLVLMAGVARGRGRAVLAKGMGILWGFTGRRVTARTLEPGGTWLW